MYICIVFNCLLFLGMVMVVLDLEPLDDRELGGPSVGPGEYVMLRSLLVL